MKYKNENKIHKDQEYLLPIHSSWKNEKSKEENETLKGGKINKWFIDKEVIRHIGSSSKYQLFTSLISTWYQNTK